MCNQRQALQILKEVFDQCSPIFDNKITEAFLYGSYARGDYHAESDIDILLVVAVDSSSIASARNQLAAITSRLSLKYDITVSVAVKPSAQFIRYADVLPYYKNVLEEGIRYAG